MLEILEVLIKGFYWKKYRRIVMRATSGGLWVGVVTHKEYEELKEELKSDQL